MRTLTASRLALVAALAIAITPPAVKAQAPGTAVVANIPFSFQIDSYHYAAGKYKVQLQDEHLLMIQGTSGSGMMEVNRDSASHPSAKNVLVFHRYGNHYFLSELRISGDTEFLKSVVSKDERRARLEEEASNRNSDGNTEVAVLASSR